MNTEIADADPKPSRSLFLWLLTAIALIWPPVYSIFVHPHIPIANSPHVSTSDLQRLLGAHRYTLHVPRECDGWVLSLESVADGKAERSGGATVRGGSDIVLLVRRMPDHERIEHCWFTENQSSRGLLNDPLRGARITLDRPPGPVQSGDWLFRGGRESITSEKSADFEVRVVLRSPHQKEGA